MVQSDWCPIVKPYDESHFIINYETCENGLETYYQDNFKILKNLRFLTSSVYYPEADQYGIFASDICEDFPNSYLDVNYIVEDLNFKTSLKYSPENLLKDIFENNLCKDGNFTNVYHLMKSGGIMRKCYHKIRISRHFFMTGEENGWKVETDDDPFEVKVYNEDLSITRKIMIEKSNLPSCNATWFSLAVIIIIASSVIIGIVVIISIILLFKGSCWSMSHFACSIITIMITVDIRH